MEKEKDADRRRKDYTHRILLFAIIGVMGFAFKYFGDKFTMMLDFFPIFQQHLESSAQEKKVIGEKLDKIIKQNGEFKKDLNFLKRMHKLPISEWESGSFYSESKKVLTK